jgi:uncharacterized membrane protein
MGYFGLFGVIAIFGLIVLLGVIVFMVTASSSGGDGADAMHERIKFLEEQERKESGDD